MTSSTPQPKSENPWDKNYPVDIHWDMDIPVGTMVDMFEDSVKQNGNKTCLNFMGKKLTYNEVSEMVDRFAKGLQDQGIGKGDRVGLCLPNSPFYVIAYYGAMKAGATVVNFTPLYAEHEMRHQTNDSQCDVMVAINVPQVLPKVNKLLDGSTTLKKVIVCDLADALPTGKKIGLRVLDAIRRPFGKADTVKAKQDKKHVLFSKMMKSKGKPKPVQIDKDDIAVLQYTGGTTGVPKAAMLSHGNLTANLNQANLWFTGGKANGKKDKMLAVLPFFHVFSMTVQMNLSINLGAELVMLPKFDAKTTLETIDKEKPTMFAGVPTLYKALMDFENVKKYDLSSLKICLSGGAALSEPIMDGWKALTGIELTEGYGLSETSPIATANPVKGQKKINSIGMPLPQTEVRIVNLEIPEQACPLKVEGEICLKGPQVMKGYWNRPDETDKVMDKDGFFHTGDVGYMDEDGYIFIVDRIKDMINASGLKVFPRKVEEAIMMHPAVSEVIVAGVPDEYRGENVKAYIVFKPGEEVSEDDMTAFLKDKLSSYERPKVYEYRDSLPKTMIGKPDRKALKAEEKERAAKEEQNKAPPKAKPSAPKPPTP
ncbi:MAG: AMP-binding protein [Alphaproteobacteria bacterium]|nr:AMP-binding protein [Alphaproteobacteria bacterium]